VRKRFSNHRGMHWDDDPSRDVQDIVADLVREKALTDAMCRNEEECGHRQSRPDPSASDMTTDQPAEITLQWRVYDLMRRDRVEAQEKYNAELGPAMPRLSIGSTWMSSWTNTVSCQRRLARG